MELMALMGQLETPVHAPQRRTAAMELRVPQEHLALMAVPGRMALMAPMPVTKASMSPMSTPVTITSLPEVVMVVTVVLADTGGPEELAEMEVPAVTARDAAA